MEKRCKVLCTVRYMLEILPNTDWSQELVRPALNLILRRLDRLFTKISKKSAVRVRIAVMIRDGFCFWSCMNVCRFNVCCFISLNLLLKQLCFCFFLFVLSLCLPASLSLSASPPTTPLYTVGFFVYLVKCEIHKLILW